MYRVQDKEWAQVGCTTASRTDDPTINLLLDRSSYPCPCSEAHLLLVCLPLPLLPYSVVVVLASVGVPVHAL